MFFRIFLLLSVFLLSALARAAAPIDFSIDYLVDESSQQSLEQILESPEENWTQSTKNAPVLGFINKAAWFRIQFADQRQLPVEFVSVVDYAPLDFIEFYAIDQTSVKSKGIESKEANRG